MDTIQKIDIILFYAINHIPHVWLGDFLGEALSGFGYAWIIWLVIGGILFLRKERKDHWFWVPLGIAAGACYVVSEVFLKNAILRPRPDGLVDAIVVGVAPSSFSYPSTHATIAFAFAYLFSRKELHWFWLYFLASAVGLSRIYLGHHFPSDVIGGMCLGTLIGLFSHGTDVYLHRIHRTLHHSHTKRKQKKV